MADRPGIMIYFDLLPQLEDYSTEEVGELFLAMLRYGAHGDLPVFSDRGLRVIWRDVQGRLDRDGASYQKRLADSKYAVYCREAKKKCETPISREKWNNLALSDDIDRNRSMSRDNQPEQELETEPETETQIETQREISTGTVKVEQGKGFGGGEERSWDHCETQKQREQRLNQKRNKAIEAFQEYIKGS